MYALIVLSVVMFGITFAIQDNYRKLRGSSLKISLQFAFIGGVGSVIVLLIANGFKVEFTPFTLIMSLAGTLIGIGYTFCSFKALGIINLSLYSLFSMLGGMLLPFLQGIIIYDEDFTLAKGVCLVFIVVALALTVEKGEKSKGFIYYAGVFALNGLSGVFSKIFTSSTLPKTSDTGYTLLSSICLVVISLAILLIFFRKKDDAPKIGIKDTSLALASGAINKIANLLLIIALYYVEASVQYPMVTGGVMIISTLICFLQKQKPSKKEIASIILAFIGMLALFVIPI